MNYSLLKKTGNDKMIFIASIFLFVYFIFMILAIRFSFGKITIIGVFRELLDIPAFLLLVVFFVLVTISLIKEKFKIRSYPFYSIIVLVLSVLSLILFIKI